MKHQKIFLSLHSLGISDIGLFAQIRHIPKKITRARHLMCYNILHLFDYVSMDIYQIDHKEHYADIVSRLVEDHILLYPTDTLRGIGSVISTQSVKHIKDIKQRSQHKTHMSIIVPDRSWIQTYTLDADIGAMQEYRDKLHAQGQGLTYILRLRPDKAQEYQDLGLVSDDTIGVRLCLHPIQDLVRMLGEPLISTSANISGEANPIQYEDISPLISNAVDMHLIGPLTYAKPSSLVNMLTGEIKTRI